MPRGVEHRKAISQVEESMPELVYVDNSNVFIEGKRVSAVKNGLAMNIWDAIDNRILDNNYRLDFGKLHTFVAGNDPSQIKRAMLFGSRPPANDSLWTVAQRAGFEVVVEDRNVQNREKKIDTGIVAAMVRDAYVRADKKNDTFTLVAGDGDYVPAVRQLVEDAYKVEVVFWGHISQELKTSASKFVDLDPYLEILALR
jgi:uncharacterized LabA/DUF88 family protein